MADKDDGPKYYEEMSREGSEKIPTGILPDSLRPLLGDESLLRVYIPPDQDPIHPFLSLKGILDIPLESIGVDDTATTLEYSQLGAYVKKTERPIGFIDQSNRVEFAKPEKGTYTSILIFVRVDDKIGVLLEKDGNSTVSFTSLPDSLPIQWYNVRIRKLVRPSVGPEVGSEEPSVPPSVPLLATKADAATQRKRPIFRRIEQPIEPIEAVTVPPNASATPAASSAASTAALSAVRGSKSVLKRV
jgi:hypothetical protein